MRRPIICIIMIVSLLMLPVGAVHASSVCPISLDADACALLQAAFATLPNERAFNVSAQLGMSKSGTTLTGVAGGAAGFFDLTVTGKQQRQGYLSVAFTTMGDPTTQDLKAQVSLIDGQWYLQTAGSPKTASYKSVPTTPDLYQMFLSLALTNGVKAAHVSQLDHPIDKQTITAITLTYDGPILFQALFTGAGGDLVKAVLGSELRPNLDADLAILAAIPTSADPVQVTYLVGPDHYFHGLTVNVKFTSIQLTTRFALEISQIGAPFKFNQPDITR